MGRVAVFGVAMQIAMPRICIRETEAACVDRYIAVDQGAPMTATTVEDGLFTEATLRRWLNLLQSTTSARPLRAA